jgi:hypothetical protein
MQTRGHKNHFQQNLQQHMARYNRIVKRGTLLLWPHEQCMGWTNLQTFLCSLAS